MKEPTTQKIPWFPWIGKKRPFYGWIIVAAVSPTQFFGGLSNQGFGTYLGFFQKEFGWSRAILASPRSVSQLESATLGPVDGWLVDKFGPRVMVSLGAFIMGLGFIVFGMVHSLWMYFLANIILSLGSGIGGGIVISVVVNHWFRRKRTLAQVMSVIGFPMAGVLGIPVLVWAQSAMGWRASLVATGLLVWAVLIPCSLFLRRGPETYGLHPDGDPPGSAAAEMGRRLGGGLVNFTVGEALRTRTFWLIAVGNGLFGLATSAMTVHLFLHLEQGVGLSRGTAALVWTVASSLNIPSRLFVGVVGDRVPKHLLLGTSGSFLAVSMLLLSLATGLGWALAFAVLYGIAWAIRTPVLRALQGQYWGRTSLGTIGGMQHTVEIALAVAGPVLAGLMADLRGDYRLTFMLGAALSLVASACMFLAKPPKPPVRKASVVSGVGPAGNGNS
ncbi:MAG: MFS transporter [Chloroflexi bacterium]|nr:MFS transporter [Chloroflexota bacterium]